MSVDELLKSLCEKSLLLVNDCYTRLDYSCRDNFVVGQLVFGLISYPIQRDLKIMTIGNSIGDYDPTEERKIKYNIEDFSYEKMQKGEYNHRPIHGDKLENDEVYIVQKGKLRTCIILNKFQSKFDNSLYSEDFYLCAPLFSLKGRHNINYILDMIKFDVPDGIFLPKDNKGISSNSFVRFSRILPLHKRNLVPIECHTEGNKPICLTDNILKVMNYHLSSYLSVDFEQKKEIQEEINLYKELISESIIIK